MQTQEQKNYNKQLDHMQTCTHQKTYLTGNTKEQQQAHMN